MIDWLKRAVVDPEITLDGDTIPIVLRRHKTARRLTLRLAPDGSEVRITLPQWAHSNEALAFAHARTDWLAQQRARIPTREKPGPGGTLEFRGRSLAINWDEANARRPLLEEKSVRIGGPLEGLEARLKRWLEREALDVTEGDLAFYCKRAELDPVPVGLSRAQKRWGSCSDGGENGTRRIRINWRLIQAPDFVRRSVVAHEVAHLVHFDHSPAFHRLLGNIYEEDISVADRWLKEKGRTLYALFG
ncbi:M48 family metallopeptidase [Erythrobacter sp. YT30]|uniref:M48 family metallopeptidase n=1 Tax=Erythrobacter sp. YT30 TaxID=1735012 RepID=UPI00076CADB0|nr:YgjP-like metallopeptidase domain-containing protein [Erythrobacter sp. YT30]KWV91035.1 metal-dependent hydrolase [Erythrobacter sp. YT30]